MAIEQDKAIIRRLFEGIFNQGNMSLVDELLAPDFVEREQLPPWLTQRS